MTKTNRIPNGYKTQGRVLIPNGTGPRKAYIMAPGWLAGPVTTWWGKNANVHVLLPYMLKTEYNTSLFAWKTMFRGERKAPDASGYSAPVYRKTIFPEVATYQLMGRTSLGYYPVIFVTADNGCLCAKCATEQATKYHLDWPRIVDVAPHWEGAPIQCDHCNEDIESAYGDPDETNESSEEN